MVGSSSSWDVSYQSRLTFLVLYIFLDHLRILWSNLDDTVVSDLVLLIALLYISLWILTFVNCLSTFVGYLKPKPPLQKNRSDAILHISRGIGGVHSFLKSIRLKENVIARLLEFELAYFEAAV